MSSNVWKTRTIPAVLQTTDCQPVINTSNMFRPWTRNVPFSSEVQTVVPATRSRADLEVRRRPGSRKEKTWTCGKVLYGKYLFLRKSWVMCLVVSTSLPLWKIWKSVIIPNIWKVIKFMFQTQPPTRSCDKPNSINPENHPSTGTETIPALAFLYWLAHGQAHGDAWEIMGYSWDFMGFFWVYATNLIW